MDERDTFWDAGAEEGPTPESGADQGLWSTPHQPGGLGGTPPSTSASAGTSPGPGVGSFPPSDLFSGHGASPSGPRRTRRRRLLAGTVALAGTLALVVSLVVVLGGGTSAEAAVLHAVNGALSDKSAKVSLNMTMNAAGSSLHASGSGAVDFSQNAMQVYLSENVDAQQVDLDVLYLGGTIYEEVPGLGQLEPGKSWVSIDLSSMAASAGTGSAGSLTSEGNPAAMLRLLAQQGNTVTALGGSTVDGVAVQGYAVRVDPAAIKSKLGAANLPDWMRQAVSGVNVDDFGFTVFVDGQGQLRRETVSMKVTSVGKVVSLDETMDLSDYGTPVSVTAPPSDQTVSFEQFIQDAEASSPTAS